MNNLAEIIIVFKLNFKFLTFGLTNPSWILTSITQAFYSTYQRSSLPSLPPSLTSSSLPPSLLPSSLPHFFLPPPSSLPPSLPPPLLLPFFLPSSLPPSLNFFLCRSRMTYSPLLSLPPHFSALNCYSQSSFLSNSLIHFLPPSFSPSLLPFSPSLPPVLPVFLPSFSPSFSAFFLRLLLPHSSPYYSFSSPLSHFPSFPFLPTSSCLPPLTSNSSLCSYLRPLITLLISPSSHSLLHSQVPLFPSLSLNNHPQFLHPPGFPTSLTHPLSP